MAKLVVSVGWVAAHAYVSPQQFLCLRKLLRSHAQIGQFEQRIRKVRIVPERLLKIILAPAASPGVRR